MTTAFPEKSSGSWFVAAEGQKVAVFSVEIFVENGNVFSAAGETTTAFGTPTFYAPPLFAPAQGACTTSIGTPSCPHRVQSLGVVTTISRAYTPSLQTVQASGFLATKLPIIVTGYNLYIDRTLTVAAQGTEGLAVVGRPVATTEVRATAIGRGVCTFGATQSIALYAAASVPSVPVFGAVIGLSGTGAVGFTTTHFGQPQYHSLNTASWGTLTRFGRPKIRVDGVHKHFGTTYRFFGRPRVRHGSLISGVSLGLCTRFGGSAYRVVYRELPQSKVTFLGRPTARRTSG